MISLLFLKLFSTLGYICHLFILEPATPENLRTIAVYKTKATLTWEVPLVPNGVVRQYRLQYKRLGDIYDGKSCGLFFIQALMMLTRMIM